MLGLFRTCTVFHLGLGLLIVSYSEMLDGFSVKGADGVSRFKMLSSCAVFQGAGLSFRIKIVWFHSCELLGRELCLFFRRVEKGGVRAVSPPCLPTDALFVLVRCSLVLQRRCCGENIDARTENSGRTQAGYLVLVSIVRSD